MGDASFAKLAPQGRKKKAPEIPTEEEDTVSDTDHPAEIGPSEITKTSRNNALSYTTNQAYVEEGDDYPPKQDAKQSPQFETASGKNANMMGIWRIP